MAFRNSPPPLLKHKTAVGLAAILSPVGYFFYTLVVRWYQGFLLNINSLFFVEIWLYTIVLALIGSIAMLDWYWGLRLTSRLALGGSMLLPWLYYSGPIEGVGYPTALLVSVCIATTLEATLRFPRRVWTVSTSREAIAAGFGHLIIGVSIQLYARDFGQGVTAIDILTVVVLYGVCGTLLVATAAFPVLLWQRYRLATPAMGLLIWLSWGLRVVWQRRELLPVSSFRGIDWVTLIPSFDYLLQVAGLVIWLLILASGELLLRTTSHQT